MKTHDPGVETSPLLRQRAVLLADDQLDLMARLIELRKEHSLSQQEIADRMGVSQPAISELERYDANPTFSTLRRYAHAIGARISSRVIDDCATAGNWANVDSVSRSLTASKSRPTIVVHFSKVKA